MTQTVTAEGLRAAAVARGEVYTPKQEIMAREHWRRLHLVAVTYGIEVVGSSLILETDWDNIASRIDRKQPTCDPILDEFFLTKFSPMTTRWARDYPLPETAAADFERHRTIMRGAFDFDRPEYRDRIKKRT